MATAKPAPAPSKGVAPSRSSILKGPTSSKLSPAEEDRLLRLDVERQVMVLLKSVDGALEAVEDFEPEEPAPESVDLQAVTVAVKRLRELLCSRSSHTELTSSTKAGSGKAGKKSDAPTTAAGSSATSGSSVSAGSNPLKFLLKFYTGLTQVYKTWKSADALGSSSLTKSCWAVGLGVDFADILSFVSMISGEPEARLVLHYRLEGTVGDATGKALAEWGHEYIRFLMNEIIDEYTHRFDQLHGEATEDDGFDQMDVEGNLKVEAEDLLKLARDIVPYCMSHNAEVDACDLLMELESLELLEPFVDRINCDRVCNYLISCVDYLPDPEDSMVLRSVYTIFMSQGRLCDALVVAVRLQDPLLVRKTFLDASADQSTRRQMALMLGSMQVDVLSELPCGTAGVEAGLAAMVDEAELQELTDSLNNSHQTKHFLKLAQELEVLEAKSPEDIFKVHLETQQRASSTANVPTVVNAFVSAFVNAGFQSDRYLVGQDLSDLSLGVTPRGARTLPYNNLHLGNQPAARTIVAAALGMLSMWDIDAGVALLDPLLTGDMSEGAVFGLGLVSSNVRHQMDILFLMLSGYLESDDPQVVRSAVLALGMAYSGSGRPDVADLLCNILADPSQPFDLCCFAGLALGLVQAGTADGESIAAFLDALICRDQQASACTGPTAAAPGGAALSSDPCSHFLVLGLALLLLGQQEKARSIIEVAKALSDKELMRMIQALVPGCAYAGTGNVLQIQQLLHMLTEPLTPAPKEGAAAAATAEAEEAEEAEEAAMAAATEAAAGAESTTPAKSTAAGAQVTDVPDSDEEDAGSEEPASITARLQQAVSNSRNVQPRERKLFGELLDEELELNDEAPAGDSTRKFLLDFQSLTRGIDPAAAAADAQGSDGDGDDDAEAPSHPHQAFATLAIGLIAMGERIGVEMSLRMFGHIMQYGSPDARRAVPLAISLIHASDPRDIAVIESLSRYSHDDDLSVGYAATFSLGMIGAGTNNARIAQILRQLVGYYQSPSTGVQCVRIAQGLLHMGKGLITICPVMMRHGGGSGGGSILSPAAVGGLMTALLAVNQPDNTIFGKYPHLLMMLSLAMRPRMLITLDAESLSPLEVPVRVGQAVDTVAQAGRPKAIAGFQTHKTPVLVASGERAELASEEYIPVSSLLEGIILLKKNPSYVPPEHSAL
ncbi:hypothetical protein H696_01546 [Fonticula alba]|uniref:26S proteasome regulatory subunit N1 n=1 Tax=Fonticula alba TaxID=691883 RepID=A0A058ZF83_FONAL|nr:hypothetical protein H696_01546 [Fonticula alba]KCV72142.1 hypothetical protein H696_01546 [Fonticula alba]|eukprot:XP_009493720.1 hypothetical protein H696_01546 [Fonticula alba]